MHAPTGEEDEAVIDLVHDCHRQVRAGFGGVYALDFPTFMRFGELKGIRPDLLADILPLIEAALLNCYREDSNGDAD